jgi:hypothetical protein
MMTDTPKTTIYGGPSRSIALLATWLATGGSLFFSEVLKAFKYFSSDYPILMLFTAMVFYFPIRPDCELQTILGHLIKSCFLIFVMMQIWKHVFKVTPTHYRFIPQE